MIYLLSQRDLELSTLPQKLNMGSYTWNQTKKIWCTSTRFCKEGISIHEALKGHICSGWHLLVKLCNPPKLRKEVIYIREAVKGHVCWGWHLLVTVVTVKLCTPTKRASRLVSLSKAMSAGDDKSCLEKQRYNLLSPLSTTNVGSKIAKSFFFSLYKWKIPGWKIRLIQACVHLDQCLYPVKATAFDPDKATAVTGQSGRLKVNLFVQLPFIKTWN